MGRRPEEDDGEQVHRRQIHRSGYRGPAHHRRYGTGRPADDDVVGRGPFQPPGIDYYVEQGCRQGQARRQQVNPDCQYRKGDNVQHNAENQRLAGHDPVVGNRPVFGSPHQSVDVPVVVVVQGVGSPGGQGAAQPDQGQQGQGRDAAAELSLRQEHTPGGGYQQQHNDGRLGQGYIIV